jgi:polysaccharide export outer membrane protein
MDRTRIAAGRRLSWLVPLAALLACGCQTVRTPEDVIAKSGIPRELEKTAMPEYVVEAPDLVRIEVLEALPGRPITGERLVRPDGKISLDFYGEIFVAGLTVTEVKEKVIIHLRQFIPDETLGLLEIDPETLQTRSIPPRDSDRVFVDISAYNSKVYYVQGDVAAPGRLIFTGNETVLDAVNYAGGLLPTAAPQNIRLVRPAPPGACCAEVLPVNLAAIVNTGDTTTNYQLMPGDRLVVYRDPIVRGTVFLNRLAEPFLTVVNSVQLFSFAARGVQFLGAPIDAGGGLGGGLNQGIQNANQLTPNFR